MSRSDMYPVCAGGGGGTTGGGSRHAVEYTILTIDPLVRDLLEISRHNSILRAAGGRRGHREQVGCAQGGGANTWIPGDPTVLRAEAAPWYPWARLSTRGGAGGGRGGLAPAPPKLLPAWKIGDTSGPEGRTGERGKEKEMQMETSAGGRDGRELTSRERTAMCQTGSALHVYVPKLDRAGPVEQREEWVGEVSRAVGNWADITIRLTLALRNQAIRSGLQCGESRRKMHAARGQEERRILQDGWSAQATERALRRSSEERAKADLVDAEWRARCSTGTDPLAEWQDLLETTEFGARAGRNETRPCEEWIYTPCNGHPTMGGLKQCARASVYERLELTCPCRCG